MPPSDLPKQILLDFEIDDAIPDAYNIALQTAAEKGRVDLVELLLKVDGIDPNFEGGELQAAPLILAAEEGHSAIVELLLAAVNIDANVRNKHFDCTPLMYACRKGHISIVQQFEVQCENICMD